MPCSVSESQDGLTVTLSAPVLPADETAAIDAVRHFCAMRYVGKARCDCPAGLHEGGASGDLFPNPPNGRQKSEVYYCTSGCGRMSCMASQAGYGTHCCKSCAETGVHSAACDANWAWMGPRIIKREAA